MISTTESIRQLSAQGKYDQALERLQHDKEDVFDEQDRVVYWMQEGMLLYLTGRYQEAIAVLEKAEQRSKELYTESISKITTSFFTSDAAQDYQGEDYEKVMMNVVKALCFVALGDWEGASVEARKINEKLKYFNQQYFTDKNVYSQDAFAQWLMGLLFEMEGSYDDARIAYVDAMDVYRGQFHSEYKMDAPTWLAEDVVRAALLSADNETANKYRNEFGATLGETRDLLSTKGELIVLHLNGTGPWKKDFIVTCFFHTLPIFVCDAGLLGDSLGRIPIVVPPDGTIIKVGFPDLQIEAPANSRLIVRAEGAENQSQMALPINAIAKKNMRDKLGRIFMKTIARAATKVATAKGAGVAGRAAGGKNKDASNVLGWVFEQAVSVAMQLTEEADKRAWTTLPGQIEVARLWLDPGQHDVELRLPDGSTKTLKQVAIVAGKRTIRTLRTIP